MPNGRASASRADGSEPDPRSSNVVGPQGVYTIKCMVEQLSQIQQTILTHGQSTTTTTGAIDLSTGQPAYASSNQDGRCYSDSKPSEANDGDLSISHPNQFHSCPANASESSLWWRVHLKQSATNPTIKFLSRDCCNACLGNKLKFFIGGYTGYGQATLCNTLTVADSETYSFICPGSGTSVYVVSESGNCGNGNDEHYLFIPEVTVFQGPISL